MQLLPSPRFWIVLLLGLPVLGLPAYGQSPDAPFEVQEHVVFDLFHGEHLGNLVYRPDEGEGDFLAWGRLPIQRWPFGSAQQTQVVSERHDVQYTDGGTAAPDR